MVNKMCSHYTCCKLRDLGGQENLPKMDAKMIRKNDQNGIKNHPDTGFFRFVSKMVDLGTPFKIRWDQKSAPGPRKDPAERVCAVFASRCFPILHCTLPHITFSLCYISLGKCVCRYPAIADARKGGFWEPRISK